MTMALGWILKRLANGSQGAGLWGYLTSRDQNKTKIKLEKARAAGTKELIQELPDGATYREGTPDGWREIQMPSTPQPPLFVLPVQQQESAAENPHESVDVNDARIVQASPTVETPRPPKALRQDKGEMRKDLEP